MKEQLKRGAKNLVGNKGYRKYLKMERESVSIDMSKVEEDVRYDGKWVLKTNTELSAEAVALKYKELWQVEHTFRDLKSTFETRPVFHQRDEAIRGHVFCSYLALVLRKALQCKLEEAGYSFPWGDIKQDLEAMQLTMLDENGKRLAVRSQCQGNCGKIFQAVGVAIPPTIQDL